MDNHVGEPECTPMSKSRTVLCKRWLRTSPLVLGLTVIFSCVCTSIADAGIGHSGKTENNGCSSVRKAYGTKGLNEWDVPLSPKSVWHLKICQHGTTCCTEDMERKLSTQSRQEYDDIINAKISLLKDNFVSRTDKFDEFFTELLDNARRDLHDMFVKTYGLLYEQNSHVFTDLFHDLKSYYKGRDLNLLDALDSFFSTLLQKMFELLNSQYSFDDAYLQCVTEHMDRLQPFGDVPRKLSVQVKRAFVAARTFVQGLATGRDVILAVAKLQSSQSCQKSVTKMLYCPYCAGTVTAKPCNNYCMNVMKGCLAHHSELNSAWNSYIDALMNVMDRLEGPFNIERVVEPIDVKISDAIMNFQENSETVSTKVFQGCGKPSYSRRRRSPDASASYDQDYFNSWKYPAPGGPSETPGGPVTAAGTSLDRLVRDIRDRVSVARDFWAGLPHAVCNDWAEPLFEEYQCWNGLRVAKYMPSVMQDGLMHQINNPEVEVDIRRPSSLVNQQILRLKLITSRLDNAFKGLDVDWVDQEVMTSSGAGSGSGDGSMDGDFQGSGSGMDQDISFGPPHNKGPKQPDWTVLRPPSRRPPGAGAPGPDEYPPYTQPESAATDSRASLLVILVGCIWAALAR